MKKFTKKLAHYFGISAIVFGSTFGSFNAANAAAVNQGTSAKNTYANADNIKIKLYNQYKQGIVAIVEIIID